MTSLKTRERVGAKILVPAPGIRRESRRKRIKIQLTEPYYTHISHKQRHDKNQRAPDPVIVKHHTVNPDSITRPGPGLKESPEGRPDRGYKQKVKAASFPLQEVLLDIS